MYQDKKVKTYKVQPKANLTKNDWIGFVFAFFRKKYLPSFGLPKERIHKFVNIKET